MVTKQFRIKIIFDEKKTTPMKKHIYIFIILSVSFLNFNAFAQQGFHSVKEISASSILRPHNTERIFYDTLIPGSQDSLGFGFCGDTLKIFKLNSPAQGYIGGNNSNGDKEIMQKFGVSGSGGVYTILALFGKKANLTNGSMIAKMYSVEPVTHAPDTMVAYTDPVSMTDIDTNSFSGLFTTFPFPGVIYTNDSFFAAIELPAVSGDTAAVYLTPHNCYSGKQLAYVLKSNGNFLPLGGVGTYGINADYWIWPVFIPDSSVGNSAISLRDLSLFRAYPNPASDFLNVKFSIRKPAQVKVDFVNELGQVVSNIDLGFQLSGVHTCNMNISHLPAGYYYYSISTQQERLFSKICIARK